MALESTLLSLSCAPAPRAHPQPIASITISVARPCVFMSSTPACVLPEQPRLRDHLRQLPRVGPLQLRDRRTRLLVKLERDRVSNAGRESDLRARVRRSRVIGPVIDDQL